MLAKSLAHPLFFCLIGRGTLSDESDKSDKSDRSGGGIAIRPVRLVRPVRKRCLDKATLENDARWHKHPRGCHSASPRSRHPISHDPCGRTYMRLLHESDLLRRFRDSGSVTYASTLPAPSPSAPCISSFVQSLSTFNSNVREWRFLQHSLHRRVRPQGSMAYTVPFSR
mgnify:CR=1 FL=1